MIVLQSLVATCIENVVELLRSNFSKEVIYEVISFPLFSPSYCMVETVKKIWNVVAFLIQADKETVFFFRQF